MLVVNVCGGLGNQMFQYAFYEYLKLNNKDVKLNISEYKCQDFHNGFELKKIFGIDGMFEDQASKLSVDKNSMLIRGARKLHLRITKKSEYFEQSEISFIPQINIKSDLYLNGYWQDIRYVKPVEDKIRKIFTFPELDKTNLEFYNKIKHQQTVSVHIRRNDYLKEDIFAGICNKKYYCNAIKLIQERIKNPLFLFFSDDIEWCRNNFSDLNSEFIDWNSGYNSYVDMQLMSLCQNHIIANSTFSWWGAWLSNGLGCTILPTIWNIKTKTNHLMEKNWIGV